MKIINIVLSVITLTLLVGCGKLPSEGVYTADQCMRGELFQNCLKALPAGPKTTMYNDWDEVVAQCENVAYYQSKRYERFIKPECR